MIAVIAALKKMGIKTSMLTGDNTHTAEAIAHQIQMDDFFAEVIPSQKLAKIEELQNIKKKDGSHTIIAMVGDGINDAPALTKADVGIAMGSGTDIAIESADIVLIQGNLTNLLNAIILSKKTYNKMIQNLFWAAIYNLIGIPFAAGVFYFTLGYFLPPGVASMFMAISSVSVVSSALLLKRVDLEKTRKEIQKHTQEEDEQKEKQTQLLNNTKEIEDTELNEQKEKGTEPNMAEKLVCGKCGEEQALPKHCGRDMIPHEGHLVCWMNLDPKFGGMNCGEAEIPEHCGAPMNLV